MAIVYVITNSAMPGLVKIGKTSQDQPDTRIAQLYSTGVPVPFDIEYACEVDDADDVEMALHNAFSPNRVNQRREFFEIDASKAIGILKLLDKARDVTAQFAAERDGIEESDTQAASRLKKRRPKLNFTEMGITEGSQLISTIDESVATVVSDTRVLYEGNKISLTRATMIVKGIDYAVAPTPFWSFEGHRLQEIYNQTYIAPD